MKLSAFDRRNGTPAGEARLGWAPAMAERKPATDGQPAAPALLKGLLPAAGQATARQAAERLELDACARRSQRRPYVLLNMISTVDGRASIGGRSGPLGDGADRELFHALRAVVDAVMVGAGTVRRERYGRMIRDDDERRRRRERGTSEEPLACVVSGRVTLPADLPLLATAGAHVAIVTPSQASLPATEASVDYVRAERDGMADLPAALAQLHERFGVDTLLCEGGPHLNAHLLTLGLVDELLLTLAPMLAGGDPASGESLRIIAGPALQRPIGLELVGAMESGSQLFLRYSVSA
jgi:riboflavin-specific deaminase-like protein